MTTRQQLPVQRKMGLQDNCEYIDKLRAPESTDEGIDLKHHWQPVLDSRVSTNSLNGRFHKFLMVTNLFGGSS